MMKLLIIGGTAFLGRFLVEACLEHGHDVTLFNRGLTNPHLFPQLERIRGDRACDLDRIVNRAWDAVIDTCAFYSPHVRSSVERFQDSGRYVYFSSVAVYDRPVIGAKEESPVARLADDQVEDELDDETYGERKARCEDVVTEVMTDRALILRPGLIVGPHSPIDRFQYWLRELSQDRKILAPGPKDRQVQIIDVRDLANWTVTMIEQGSSGVYNAVGPAWRMSMQEFLQTCRNAIDGRASLVWVDEDFLLQRGVKPWSELPLWLPQETEAFMAVNGDKAMRAGLVFRPLEMTARDTFSWDRCPATDDDQFAPRETVLAEGQIGLTRERQLCLLREWSTSIDTKTN